jgi:hypothetical protein
MPAGVRNGVLGRGVTSASRSIALGPVPSNFTWLLKTVHLWNSTGSAENVAVRLNSADGLVRAYLRSEQLAANAIDTWDGWTALMPGDQLIVDGAAGIHVWAAGAELPGVVT